MPLYFRFDKEKAIAAVVYICRRLLEGNLKTDLHRVFKILYFADREHIVLYGRPILGDHYIAMEHGPVPSSVYDMIKMIRGDSILGEYRGGKKFASVRNNYYIHPNVEPDLSLLAESEMECLNESISKNGDLSFDELKNKSHGVAYGKAKQDDKISFIDMAKEAGATQETISYMKTLSENERLLRR